MSEIKLNIGCGDKILPNYINVDVRPMTGVDVVHDLNQPLPFADNYADFILASDVLEHFPMAQTDSLLKDWARVLKPGGSIHVRVPNMELICERLYKSVIDPKELIILIYGGQEYEFNFHKAGFTKPMLGLALARAGCSMITKIWDSDHNTNMIAVKQVSA